MNLGVTELHFIGQPVCMVWSVCEPSVLFTLPLILAHVLFPLPFYCLCTPAAHVSKTTWWTLPDRPACVTTTVARGGHCSSSGARERAGDPPVTHQHASYILVTLLRPVHWWNSNQPQTPRHPSPPITFALQPNHAFPTTQISGSETKGGKRPYCPKGWSGLFGGLFCNRCCRSSDSTFSHLFSCHTVKLKR